MYCGGNWALEDYSTRVIQSLRWSHKGELRKGTDGDKNLAVGWVLAGEELGK